MSTSTHRRSQLLPSAPPIPRGCRVCLVPALVALAITSQVPLARAQVPPPPNPQASLLARVDFQQRLDAQVPLDLKFRDERGATVALRDYFGERPVVLALVYYQCPQLCNQVLNGLTTTLKAIDLNAGQDFEVLVVSFDPREGPELAASKKAAYLDHYDRPGTESGWHFLTGETPAIEALCQTVGFQYQFEPRSGQYAHASGIMVVTPEGRLSRYFYGIDFPTRGMRLGLVESSAGTIGSPVDQILLFCFHYDPLTGKYGLAIRRMLQAGGALTLLGLGGGITLMLRAERRQRRADAAISPSATPH